jgi:NAD(P)-dependent dehydrogenase (short-subunit alcohol dehydrogenase family)
MPTSHSNQPRRASCSPGPAAASGRDGGLLGRRPARHHLLGTRSRKTAPGRWARGPHQVDLADPADTLEAISEIKQRLEHGDCTRWSTTQRSRPRPRAASGCLDQTTVDVWDHVFRVNFFAPIMLARGLMEELRAAKGSVVNVTSIAGSRVHPFAGTAVPPRRRRSPRSPARWRPISAARHRVLSPR